jgi:hypothetical protein
MSVAETINPFAPPPTPAQIDFREAAVEESLRLLEANPGCHPDELPLSLVLPADVGGVAVLRHIARLTLVRLILALSGLAAGALLAAVQGKLAGLVHVSQGLILTLAGLCSIGGIVLLSSSVFLVRRTVRRALGTRYEAVVRLSTLRPPLCVGVEDARTFTKMKLAPEDFAYVGFDAAQRRLILEGLLFRYMIRAADVLTVGQAQGSTTTGTQIVFRVGRVVVGVTLQFDSVWHELKRQLFFTRQDALLAPIWKTLSGADPQVLPYKRA